MRKKNRGLTIPELLIVLVIIGILSIVGIVTVNRTKEKQRETYNLTQNTLFVETAKLYFEDHKDLLPKSLYESEYVTLDELIADKYFDDYIKDYDKNNFSGSSKVKVTKVGDNKYVYSGVLKDQEGNTVVETPDSPSTITFTYKDMSATNGKYYVNKTPYIDVTMHDEDTLVGYTFVIYKDNKVYKSSNTIEIENAKSFTETLMLNTNSYKDGEYKIEITAHDAMGHKKSKTSSVIVIDKTAPKCSFDITGTLGLKGWYKTDATLKLTVTEKNKVNLKQGIVDSTTVSYNDKTSITQSDTKGKKWYGYVKDVAGNTGKCDTTVKVDTKKPVCSFANLSTDFVITGEKATIGLTCSDATSYIDSSTMKFTLSDNIEISSTAAKLVSISDPVVENNGSKYTITFEGVSYGSFKISLKANSISDNVGFKNDKATSTTINSYNRTEIPNNSLCVSRTYNGKEQQLTSTTLGTGYKLSGYNQTNANESGYTITATLDEGYRWSDKSATTKTFKCPLHKATPTITLSESSGIIATGSTRKFTATVKSGAANGSVSGKLNVTSGTTSVATVNPNGDTTITNANNTTGVGKETTITGVSAGSSTITVKFTPSDAANYDSATNKTYSATVKKAATIPTAANYCKSLTYTGSEQTLVKDPGEGFTWTSGTKRTEVGYQTVTATLKDGYIWDDYSSGTKTISCSINKATPTISLNSTSATIAVGSTVSVKATIKSGSNKTVSGTYYILKNNVSNYSKIKMSSSEFDNLGTSVSATASGTDDTEYLIAKNSPSDGSDGTDTYTIKFKPSDTDHYNESDSKTYTITVTKLTLTATFTKGTNISAISSTSASCTVTSTSNISCKVTPPNVMASTGYAVSSWTRSSGNTSSTANVNPSSTSGSLGSLEYRFASDSISLCGNTTYTATARYANSSEVQYGYNGQATVKDALDDLYSKLN